MTHDVTIVHVPLIRQTSAFLLRMLRVMSFSGQAGSMLTPAISQHGLLAEAGSFTPIQGRVLPLAARLCFLASLPPRGCIQEAIKVSWLCTTILRYWRKRFLLHMGHVSMFPRCCCCVLWEEPRRRLAHCLSLDRPKAVFFFIDFDSGQWSATGACHPFIEEELMEDGQASKSSVLQFLPH